MQYARDFHARPYGWYRRGRSLSPEERTRQGLMEQPDYYDPELDYNARPDEALEHFLDQALPAELHQAVLDDPHARQLIFALLDGDEAAAPALEDRLREMGLDEPRNMTAQASGARHTAGARAWNQTPANERHMDHPETYYPLATQHVEAAIRQVKKPRPPQQPEQLRRKRR